MIPGHNLTGYMGSRYASYRPSLGGTRSSAKAGHCTGLVLYERAAIRPRSASARSSGGCIRAARIIFSMSFHLGRWSPQECIDFLVDRVGHERDNATAEVRRSFQQAAPLYQAAYLLGGLQIRSLQGAVESGTMTEKQFHDEMLRQGNMPVALHRLAISKMKLTRDTLPRLAVLRRDRREVIWPISCETRASDFGCFKTARVRRGRDSDDRPGDRGEQRDLQRHLRHYLAPPRIAMRISS